MLVLTATMLTVGVAVAVASSPVPKWNSGYNGWWPGGFGYPPVTVQANGYPCSLTAYGTTFHSRHSEWTQDYGAGVSCAGGVGVKKMTVSDQVLGNHGRTWYTINGSTFTGGASNTSPLRMRRTRSAFLGRAYRVLAKADLLVPNGHAGCSLTNTCDQSLTISATSRALGP
ncbi:MAG TPA: hypothetical protein VGF93_01390 [Solirubrobacteraceae bacterium]|jgi:hypothetical protein